jgi:TM2 domain-containing membrane protein YozV
MLSKIKEILGSIRFYMITFGSASAYMAYVELNGFSWSSLLNAVAIWLGVVAGVGTIDKATTKE